MSSFRFLTKEILMSTTIIVAGLTLLYKLFGGRKAKTNKKRRILIYKIRLFFNYSEIEKFNVSKKSATNTNYIVIEDKFDKLKNFAVKNEEQINEKSVRKPDQIFFKLLKNFSSHLSEKNTNRNSVIKKKR